MRLVPPTADHRGLRHCPMLSSSQKKERSSRVEEGVRMAPITIKGALISCLGGNIQKLAKHASFFVTLWYTTPSPFQQSPTRIRHVHGIPFSTALHASALHCPPPRDSDALIAYALANTQAWPYRAQRWGPAGEGRSHRALGRCQTLTWGRGLFVGGRWEPGCAQLEAARNLTLADGDWG